MSSLIVESVIGKFKKNILSATQPIDFIQKETVTNPDKTECVSCGLITYVIQMFLLIKFHF